MGISELDVFVVHARALQNRARALSETVRLLEREVRVNVRMVTSHDTCDIDADSIKRLTGFEPLSTEVTPLADRFNAMIRVMHVNAVSSALKHLDCLRQIGDRPGDALCLVLEDDSVVAEARLAEWMRLLIDSDDFRYDFVIMGETGLTTKYAKDTCMLDVNAAFDAGAVLPVCNAYAVRPSFARELAERVPAIKFAWNVQLSLALHVCDRSKRNVVATSAPVFLDGTKTGRFVSTLTGDNKLSQCPAFSEMCEELTRLGVGQGKAASAAVERALAAPGVLADHPDVLRTYASHLTSLMRHAEAHAVLERAVRVMLRHPLVFTNNHSALLKQYIRSFAHVQEEI